MKRYLSVSQVASEMNISKMTIYRLVDAGDIPALRVGRSVRILEQDLAEYIIRNTTKLEEAK